MEADHPVPVTPVEDVVRRQDDGDDGILRYPQEPSTVLDRLIPLGGDRAWQMAGLIAVIIAALVLRLTRLNAEALNPQEAPFA